MNKTRVIQCYTGAIAKQQIKMIVEHPKLELVGALVFHDDKHGLDIGEIAGIENLGLKATNKLDDILALDADVALYNPPYDQYHEIIALLESGKNVITATGGYNPKMLADYQALEDACKIGKCSYMGSGINPGYAPDVLPMVASALCSHVEHVHVYAGGDLSGSVPSTLELMGFGKPIDKGESETFFDFVVPAYKNSTYLLADALGLQLDDVVIESEFEPALNALDAPIAIDKGAIAGIRLSTIGVVNADKRITLEITWFLGRKNVRASWLGEARATGWTVQVTGEPDIKLAVDIGNNLQSGTQLTAARMVNDIPMVCHAAPGAVTFLDSPIPRARL